MKKITITERMRKASRRKEAMELLFLFPLFNRHVLWNVFFFFFAVVILLTYRKRTSPIPNHFGKLF